MTHLWESKHPYYCNLGNYYHSGCGAEYETWEDFVESEGGSDLDMNLVFRFDWIEKEYDGNDEEPFVWDQPPHTHNATLYLFYMGQRKGLYRWVEVSVCRADEPAVREWLSVRYEHMLALWSPFSTQEASL